MTKSIDTPLISGYEILEQIYCGSRTQVYRARRKQDSRPVVIKCLAAEYPSFNELLQFRNQYVITENLQIPGIVRSLSLEIYGNRYALVMEDFGEISLQEYAQVFKKEYGTFSDINFFKEFCDIALQLVNILHELNQQRIIHKDIKPANILINPETKQVKLIDFSIASLLPRETQEIKSPNVLEGTLAYISPEQTGRMNRGIDYRSDFYSLGVTFYELLTGELPFKSDDAMELVHCHIAKQPPIIKPHPSPLLGKEKEPHPSPLLGKEREQEIPQVLSDIVMKLMAKNAEERYQSALGLKHDLEKCLSQLESTGKIVNFPIAEKDICDRFIIPEKLYGRENEVEQLLAAFDRVSAGNSELILVAGFSGIGKTAVVNEVHKPIVKQRGFFIKGKYDQFNRNIPLSAFVQAFSSLMGQILGESEAQLKQWKSNILDVLGENGQVIIDVIPSLEKIIGQQPPVTELSGSAAQNRFNLLFQKFIQIFTTKEHPLVIFLDDLQWADTASLNLIQLLMNKSSAVYLLMIGAYRDNEVFPAHPLMLTLEDIYLAQGIINTITLAPLGEASLNILVADTLNCSLSIAEPLTHLIYQKTKGNPFFSTQFLKGLHQDDLIKFDYDTSFWVCDIAKITTASLTDDVVEFMALQLQKFPQETQNILKLAACIGNQFDLPTLAIVSQQSEVETAADLWKALQFGLILPTSEVYKFYFESDIENHQLEENINQNYDSNYKFLHDRVQQAAYFLIPEEEKKATHAKIGRLLWKNTHTSQLQERIFAIANQLNIGIEYLNQPSERHEVARLNFIAGEQAKNSTAYNSAITYLKKGLELLPSEPWESDYNLTFNLYTELTEACYLGGEFDAMEEFAQQTLQNAKAVTDTAKIHEVKIEAYIVQGKLLAAIDIGMEFLRKIGIDFPAQPSEEDFSLALQETQTLLSGKTVAQLADLPQIENPKLRKALPVLVKLDNAVYIAKPELHRLLILKEVTLCVKYGNTANSAFAYSAYGFMLCGQPDNIAVGYEFGQLALQLLSKYENKEYEVRVIVVVHIFITHWKESITATLKPLLRAYTRGLESGDLAFAGYGAFMYGLHSYICGQELTKLYKQLATYGASIEKINQKNALNYNNISHQVVLNLVESKTNPWELIGSIYNETEMVSLHEQANDGLGLWNLFINKLILAYLFQKYDLAVEYTTNAKKYSGSGYGMITIPLLNFYDSLVQLNLFPNYSSQKQQDILQQVSKNQQIMQKWAHHNPMNYLHKFYLVEAEKCRVLDQKLEAIELYNKAISGAKENEYLQEEALANELKAKFYLDWGEEKAAAGYMQEAYYCYSRWGAKAKTDDLEKGYPQLLRPILQQRQVNLNPLETIAATGWKVSSSSTLSSSIASTSISDALDFSSILKAAQSISSCIELDQLVTSLTQIILENSGAKKTALILRENQSPENETWIVKAITTINCQLNSQEKIETILTSKSIDTCQEIPPKMINYVKNTQKTIIIDNCKTDIPGVIGEYMMEHQPKSVLCTPIVNQGNLLGILYLENKITSGVFTFERQQIINLLSSQAAISIENAQLFTNLQASEARFLRLAENAPGMIYQFQLSPEGILKFNYVSAGCYRIFEVSVESVFADAENLNSLIHSEEMANFQQSVAISAQTLQTWQYQGRIITPSGKVKWIHAASCPVKQTNGTIIWDGLLLDITQRKQAENAVKQKSQELENALKNLQKAQLQIVQSEKMSALGNLVAGVAHEMNNPLGFIYATLKQTKPALADITEHLKLYQETLPEPGDEILNHAEEIDLDYSLEDLPKMVDAMVMACDRLKNISTSLRTFSRADQDYKVSFNIHDGLDSTILILKHRIKANDKRPEIEVIKDYGDLPKVECFPGQLNQVFMNILANAIDALEEFNTGRSFEEIKINPNKITIKTSMINDNVKISIMDNGKGISEEVKTKIFDHLFTTKDVVKGTGLGLAIAKQILEEKHGGKLSCNSVLGQGTEFLINIPLSSSSSST